MAVSTTQTIVTNSAWTEIGPGPMALQALEGESYIAIADSAPSNAVIGESFVLRPRDGYRDFDTTSNLWAMAATVSGKAVLASAPITA
jgi:hypothetical protein